MVTATAATGTRMTISISSLPFSSSLLLTSIVLVGFNLVAYCVREIVVESLFMTTPE